LHRPPSSPSFPSLFFQRPPPPPPLPSSPPRRSPDLGFAEAARPYPPPPPYPPTPTSASTGTSTPTRCRNSDSNVGTSNALSIRRSEEHTSELQSLTNLVCRLLLEKKKIKLVILMRAA